MSPREAISLGFVAVPDDHTLLVADRPGNKKLLTLSNVLEKPNVALIFLVPGREDSLRLNGRAQITRIRPCWPHWPSKGRIREVA